MATRIIWQDHEWDKLAMKLAEWRPDRMFKAKLNLVNGEVEHAMKMVIQADRQRPKRACKQCKVTPYLHSAYKRLRERNRKIMSTIEAPSISTNVFLGQVSYGHVLPNGKRMWSHDGWLAVAKELDRLYPNIFDDRLKSMRLPQFREAQRVLPPELRKTPKALDVLRNGLLKVWDIAQRSAQPGKASATVKPMPKPDGARTHWDAEEWITLAAEIDRINPHQKFIESKTLASLKPSDIRPAMNALPVARRRDVITASAFKDKLLQAFATLRVRRASEALLPPKVEVQEQPAIAAPVPEVQPAELNKYEAAFAPLIELLADGLAEKVAHALLPRVSQLLHDLLQSSGQQEPPESAGSTELNGHGEAANKIVSAYREKLPRIAVIGPKGQLQRRLENTFKNVAFSFIDSSNHPSRRMHDLVRNCDRVIGATKFISHATEGVISKEVGNRYQAVHGGVTGIERQIAVWMRSGEIPNVGNLPIEVQ